MSPDVFSVKQHILPFRHATISFSLQSLQSSKSSARTLPASSSLIEFSVPSVQLSPVQLSTVQLSPVQQESLLSSNTIKWSACPAAPFSSFIEWTACALSSTTSPVQRFPIQQLHRVPAALSSSLPSSSSIESSAFSLPSSSPVVQLSRHTSPVQQPCPALSFHLL